MVPPKKYPLYTCGYITQEGAIPPCPRAQRIFTNNESNFQMSSKYAHNQDILIIKHTNCVFHILQEVSVEKKMYI